MKKMYFWAAALILLFAACSKDQVNVDDDDGIVTSLTGDAWVSVSIASKSQGRALHDPNQQTGTKAETNVEEVRAIFFDEDEKVTEDKILSTEEAGKPGQTQGNAGKAFKVPAKSKRILIIANPADNLPAKGSFTDFATFNEALNELNVNNVSTTDKFMMTNAKGGLEPSYEYGSDKDLVLYNSAEKAQARPLSIRVDRVESKVRVRLEAEMIPTRAHDPNTTSPNVSDYAEIYQPEWVLNVTNKWYFPVSQRTPTWAEDNNNLYESPYDQYELGSYRKDPNYDTQVDPTVNKSDYDKQYHYYYNAAEVANTIPWKSANVGNEECEYCLENTQTKTHNMWAYTTQVLFKVVFSPHGMELPNGEGLYTETDDEEGGYIVDDGALRRGEDWIMYDGGFYTWGLLMLYIEKEMESKYLDENADMINTPIANALNAYLKAIGLTEVDIPASDGNEWTQINQVVDAFKAHKDAVKTHGAARHGSITYYKGGVSYYPIMIKHDDTEDADNELGEFGVVRNSVYDIRITKVNNPGYPTIPDPNPGIPDESEAVNLSVKIDINPWTWYSQSLEL